MNCPSCGSDNPEGARFCGECAHPIAETLLCPSCGPGDPGGIDCPVAAIKVLRVAASGDAGLYARLRLGPEVLTVLEAVAELELARHIDRRLRSLEVLRALL